MKNETLLCYLYISVLSSLDAMQARWAEYLSSNNYYERRLSVNIFASESALSEALPGFY